MMTSKFLLPFYFSAVHILTKALYSTLMSLNCPTGQTDKLIEAVNKAAAIIRELSLAR
jgi:hypothetical protein